MNILLENIIRFIDDLNEEQKIKAFNILGDFVSLLDSEFENNDEGEENEE